MTAKEALEIIVDLLEKAGPDKIQRAIGSRILLDDIETIAISYEEMDYEIERDMVDDEGRFDDPNLMTTSTASVRPSP
jgi:hypothetical protein